MPKNLTVENVESTGWFNQFNEKQQEEIKLGLQKNVDVSVYAKPELSYLQMKKIRKKLENERTL